MKSAAYQRSTCNSLLKLFCFDVGRRSGVAKANLKSSLAAPVKVVSYKSIIKTLIRNQKEKPEIGRAKAISGGEAGRTAAAATAVATDSSGGNSGGSSGGSSGEGEEKVRSSPTICLLSYPISLSGRQTKAVKFISGLACKIRYKTSLPVFF